MNNIISFEQRKSEREQRRISPQLQRAARLRETALKLMLEAKVLEIAASEMLDYGLIGDPRQEATDA